MAVDRIAQLAVDIVINTRRARAQLSNFRRDLNKNTQAINRMSTSLGTIGLAASGILLIRRAFRLATEAILTNVEAFASLEKKIIDVQKVSSLPVKDLTRDFLELGETISGVSFDEIGATMAAAARMGIPGGSQGLKEFTDVAVKLSQVSDDIDSINAAQGLSRLIINFGLTAKEANSVASGINELSNSFTVTAGEILTSSARLAGFANAVDVTVSELNALVAFLVKSGQTSTVTRSSLNRLFQTLIAEPIKAAEALKLPREELENFISARVIDRVKQFFVAFKGLDELRQVQALKDLGIAGPRVAPAIFAVANDLENLDKALRISNEATEQATSLLDKHATVAGTTDAKLKDLTKTFETLKARALDAAGIVDIFTGAVVKLESALEDFGLGGLDIEADKLPSNLKALRAEIDKIDDLLIANERRRKELDRPLLQHLGRAAFALTTPGLLGGAPREIATEFLEGFGLSGRREDLQNKKRLTNEKIDLLLKNKGQKAEEAAIEETKKAADALEAKRKIDAAAEVQNEKFLEDARELSFGLNNFESSLRKVEIVLEDQLEEFRGLLKPSKEVRIEFIKLRQGLIKERKAIEQQQAETRAATLNPFLGKIGQVTDLLDQFQQAVNLGIPGLAADLRPILHRQIEGIFNQERRPNAFIGLTEAWKQAQIATNKNNPLLLEQIRIAEIAARIIGRSERELELIKNVLEQIRDNERQGGGAFNLR